MNNSHYSLIIFHSRELLISEELDQDKSDSQIHKQIIQKSFVNWIQQFTTIPDPKEQFLYESDMKTWPDIYIFSKNYLMKFWKDTRLIK